MLAAPSSHANEGDNDVIEHYLHIAESMARAHDELRRSMRDVVAAATTPRVATPTIVDSEPSQRPANADEWSRVRDDLEEVASLYSAISDAVELDGSLIDQLNRDVESGAHEQRRAEQAIRHYHDRHVTVAQAGTSPRRAWLVPLVFLVFVGAALALWRVG